MKLKVYLTAHNYVKTSVQCACVRVCVCACICACVCVCVCVCLCVCVCVCMCVCDWWNKWFACAWCIDAAYPAFFPLCKVVEELRLMLKMLAFHSSVLAAFFTERAALLFQPHTLQCEDAKKKEIIMIMLAFVWSWQTSVVIYMLFLLSICLCQTLQAEINYVMKMFSKCAQVNVIIIISVNLCCCFFGQIFEYWNQLYRIICSWCRCLLD